MPLGVLSRVAGLRAVWMWVGVAANEVTGR